jgi:hypothetical protein
LRKSDVSLYEIIFYTGLLPVKDEVFMAYTKSAPETFFKLTDAGWEPAVQAKLVVIDNVVPPNVTVNEWPCARAWR